MQLLRDPRRHATAPPRHRAAAPPRRRATAPPRRRAATLPDAAASPRRNAATPQRRRTPPASPRRNAVVPPVAPPIVLCSRLHRAVQSAAQQPQPPVVPWLHVTPPSPPPAFGAGLGQRRIRLLERGARWCAARQLPRERRRQQIVRQGADTRRLRPLGRRRAGHDGRELRHAQWPRDQLAGRGKHAQRVGLLAAAELATYGSRRPLSPLCMAARLALFCKTAAAYWGPPCSPKVSPRRRHRPLVSPRFNYPGVAVDDTHTFWSDVWGSSFVGLDIRVPRASTRPCARPNRGSWPHSSDGGATGEPWTSDRVLYIRHR